MGLKSLRLDDLRQYLHLMGASIITLGDGTPYTHRCLLLWRKPPPGHPPLTAPAEAHFYRERSSLGDIDSQAEALNYIFAIGKTTVKVVPSPNWDSTQIRPLWLSRIDFTIDNPNPVPETSSGTLLARKKRLNK